MCYTPPLYTNNKLTLAEGFTPPQMPMRIRADCRGIRFPTGLKPYRMENYAVKGDPFGTKLSEEDRKALIAFSENALKEFRSTSRPERRAPSPNLLNRSIYAVIPRLLLGNGMSP
jgi:hypothetical protein